MADEPEVAPEAAVETPAAEPENVVADRLAAAERRIAEQAEILAAQKAEADRLASERARAELLDKEKRLAKIKEYAASGQDALAPDYLELRDEVDRLKRDREEERAAAEREKEMLAQFNADLAKIKDAEERKAVRDHFAREYAKRPGLDIAAARAEVREKKLAEENETLRQAIEASKQKPREGIQTHHRDVTTSVAKVREVSRADWQREQESLENDDKARVLAQLAMRKGAIRFKD